MQQVWRAVVGVSLFFSWHSHADVSADACLSEGWSYNQWVSLKDAQPPGTNLQSLALKLRYCLASPDPALRDEVAFSLLSEWLRSEQLTESTRLTLLSALSRDITERNDTEQHVYLPFALLVIAEIVRTDRISTFLTDKQRDKTLSIVSDYLSDVTDYRGFDADIGWRHNIAHGADVYLQLGLNSSVSAAQLEVMAQSLAGLINPATSHFYHYGEPQRLARATAYLMLRDALPVLFWQEWLERVASPAPYAQWSEVFGSQAGLAKRHNTRAFLLELSHMIQRSDSVRLQTIHALIVTHLQASA